MIKYQWLFICLSIDYCHSGTLRFVHAVWRHGDRSPTQQGILTDTKNNESSWPQGWGELTQKGMRQHYELGLYLRNRYADFLSEKYDKREIYIMSTNYNRTIMSAMANMAGLYKPKDAQVWNKTILWQPVPIHSKQYNKILNIGVVCKKRDKMMETLEVPQTIQEMNEKYSDLFQLLANYTGNNVSSVADVGAIYDTLYCQMHHNNTRKWPNWVTWDLFTKICDIYDKQLGVNYVWDEIKRFDGGLLLGDIMDRMLYRSQNNSLLDQKLKLYAYSAHDSTVIMLLSVLGAFNNKQPGYASVILIELHEIDGQFTVQLWYKNDTNLMPYYLHISDCPEPCLLSDFVARSVHLIPKDSEAECENVDIWFGLRLDNLLSWFISISIVLFVIVVILLSIIIYLFYTRRKKYAGMTLIPTSHNSSDSDINELLEMEEFK